MFDFSKEQVATGLEEFVIEFYEDRQQELSLMLDSLAKNDLDSIGALAHKWRGFCSPYGFQHLEGLSISLEESARGKNTEESKNLIEKISDYLEKKGEFLGIEKYG